MVTRVRRPRWPGTPAVVAAALGAVLLGFLLVPLAALVDSASWAGLSGAVRDPAFRTSLGFTLAASGVAVALSLAVGTPLGYLLARHRFPGRTVVESAVLLPMIVPHLIVGIALFLVLRPGSLASAAFAAVGVPLLNAAAAVILVMVYLGAPYVVLASALAFRSVDESIVEAARSLGATPAEAFANVTFPLALRGIVTGALLAWARGVSEIGAFLVLAYSVGPGFPYGGPVTSPASVYVYNQFQVGVPGAVASSALLILVALAVFVGVRVTEKVVVPRLPSVALGGLG